MISWRKELKATLVLGLPMAGAQLSQTLMGTTDVAMVGRLEGDALAAMAVGQASYGLFLTIGIGLVAAIGPLVSQAYGANNRDAVARAVAVGSCLSFCLALLFWPLLYRVDLLFAWLEYPPELAALATGYVRTVMLGLPFAFLFFVMKNYLDSVSRPRAPMVVAMSGVIVNGVADYALIYGHFGLPALGVVGTGVATSTVNLFMAATLMMLAWKPDFTAALRVQSRRDWKEFLSVGLPISGSLGVEVGLFVVGALMMGRLGSQEAAAHQIVLVLAATTFMVPLGISFAGATRVGQAVGRRDFQAIRSAGLAAILVGCGFMVLTAIVFLNFPGALVDLFWDPGLEQDLRVKVFAMELLTIAGFFQIADGLQVTAMGALRGMKDVNVPLAIAGMSYWVVGLGAASLLAFYTPLRHQGLWIGFLLGLATAGTALLTRFLLLSRRVCHDPQLQRRVAVEAAQ